MKLKNAKLYMSKEEFPKLIGARAVFEESVSVEKVRVDIKCTDDGFLTDYRVRDSKDLAAKQLENLQQEVINIAERLTGNAATALEACINKGTGQKRKQ